MILVMVKPVPFADRTARSQNSRLCVEVPVSAVGKEGAGVGACCCSLLKPPATSELGGISSWFWLSMVSTEVDVKSAVRAGPDASIAWRRLG